MREIVSIYYSLCCAGTAAVLKSEALLCLDWRLETSYLISYRLDQGSQPCPMGRSHIMVPAMQSLPSGLLFSDSEPGLFSAMVFRGILWLAKHQISLVLPI